MTKFLIVWTLFALQMFTGTAVVAHPGSGIVVDKNGQVYFTDTGRGMWKIDTTGTLTFEPAPLYHWMAIDETGVFARSELNFGNWFARASHKGANPTLLMCSDFPLTVNVDGNIYYTDTRRATQQIVRRTVDGTETVVARGEIFGHIGGITAGADGTLYVTDNSQTDSSMIRKISMDGIVSRVAGFAAPRLPNDARVAEPLTAVSAYCRGLAVDSLGVVYVAATGSARVLKITVGGEMTTILNSENHWEPTGVAVFQGEVYVLEWRIPITSRQEIRRAWVPRVRKVGRDGTVSVLAVIER